VSGEKGVGTPLPCVPTENSTEIAVYK